MHLSRSIKIILEYWFFFNIGTCIYHLIFSNRDAFQAWESQRGKQFSSIVEMKSCWVGFTLNPVIFFNLSHCFSEGKLLIQPQNSTKLQSKSSTQTHFKKDLFFLTYFLLWSYNIFIALLLFLPPNTLYTPLHFILHSLIAIAYKYAYSYTFLKYIFGIIMLYQLYDYTLYLNIFIHINEILWSN